MSKAGLKPMREKCTCARVQPARLLEQGGRGSYTSHQSIKKDVRVLPTCLPGQGGFRYGDVAIQATKQVTRMFLPVAPDETNGVTVMRTIDLSYRPDTYWPESLTPDQLLSRIRYRIVDEYAELDEEERTEDEVEGR
jgi:hypothetical protein